MTRLRLVINVLYGIAIGLSIGFEVCLYWALAGLPS